MTKKLITFTLTFALVAAALGVAPAAQAVDGPNLLINPGFENPYSRQCCHTEAAFPPNTPIDEVQVAFGWRAWWLEPRYPDFPPTCTGCMSWHRPEWREAAPFANRIHSGGNAQKYFTFFSTHKAGMYQQVSGVQPGQRLRFSIYMQAWSANGSGLTSTIPDNDLAMKVGIDPTGGTDAFSDRIVWSTPFNTFDVWGLYSVEAVAQSSTVTVFTHTQPRWGMEHNDFYLDDASLVVVDGSSAPAPTATPVPATVAPAPTTAPAPTAVPTTVPAVAPSFISYTVQRGDTLRKIATRFNTTVAAILSVNSLANPNRINVGQVLRIPASGASVPAPTSAAPAPTSAPPANLATYTVQRGDTLRSIARKFGTTASAIIAVNPGINPNVIFPGQVLNLPFNNVGAGKTYVVQRGDTLRKIAAKFNTTIAVLQQLNSLSDPNKIYIGQTLVVP
jgi:LysM repeat protein